MQSATHAEAGADTRLRDLGVLFRPDVHGQEAAAGSVACLIAPTSPSADKWETLWHYMQGGPSIFLGDIHYYFADGDLRNADLAGLDADKCPLYLLTGEYDLSATPELLGKVRAARARLSAAIARVRELDDVRFRDFHARRLTEMSIDVSCAYLLMRAAQDDARRLLAAAYFVVAAAARVEGAATQILGGDPAMLDALTTLAGG